LIDLARKEPGELSHAVTGVGRLTHLTRELLQLRAGIKLQMVPYSGNSAQAITDVYAGRIPIMIDDYTALMPGVSIRRSGAARRRRVAASPECPGPADHRRSGSRSHRLELAGDVGSERYPGPIAAKASEALRAALEIADVREPLAARGSFVHRCRLTS
jgi:tripartite-type tricarboxylate transporter receptor subunit TctC